MWVNQKSLTIPQLKTIDIPERGNTVSDRWKGIRHYDLVSAVTAEAENRNLEITGQHILVNPAQTDLYAHFDFNRLPGVKRTKDFGFSLGVIHSNMSRKALCFLAGATVFVCSNGMVIAEHISSRKHTTRLNLFEQVQRGYDQYLLASKQLVKFRENLINSPLDNKVALVDRALIESAEKKLVPWSGIGKVWKHWNTPDHTEFTPRTRWSLYNAFTEAGKEMSAPNNARLLRGLSKLSIFQHAALN